jgi:hypothetical protein
MSLKKTGPSGPSNLLYLDDFISLTFSYTFSPDVYKYRFIRGGVLLTAFLLA